MSVLYFVLNFRVHFIFSVVRRGKIPLRRGKFDVLRSTRKDSLIVCLGHASVLTQPISP